jgi:voltage-gated potassium channel
MANRDQPIERANGVLLLLVCLTVFVVPVFPTGHHQLLYNLLFSLTFFSATLAVKRHRRRVLLAAVVIFVVEWVAIAFDLSLLTTVSRTLNVFFFSAIVVILIGQIIRNRQVSVAVILEAINSYLLLGLAFGLLVTVIMIYDPAAYNFPPVDPQLAPAGRSVSQYLYYAFVSFTTLGYGDMLPLEPYTQSLGILIAITGQLYVAVILALLVGKYASTSQEE